MESVQQHLQLVVDKVSAKILPTLQALPIVGPNIKGINYLYGHLLEVSNTIMEWSADSNLDSDENLQLKRFPLIALLEDKSDITQPSYNGYRKTRLNIIICMASKPEWKSIERETKTFDPILRVIYTAFMKQLSLDGYFAIYSPADMPHQAIDRKFWGTESETKNRFNDFIDAIEIQNLELKYFPQC